MDKKIYRHFTRWATSIKTNQKAF